MKYAGTYYNLYLAMVFKWLIRREQAVSGLMRVDYSPRYRLPGTAPE